MSPWSAPSPHVFPDASIIVDVSNDGTLHADVRTGASDAANGFTRDIGLQFHAVGVVAHDAEGASTLDHIFKETQDIIGVGIADSGCGQ